MQFIVIRLGKDSVADIERIDAIKSNLDEPFKFEFTCKQVEQAIKENAYVFIYLGSDNNKGIQTAWKKGLRAIGLLQKISGWENFQSTCTLSIKVFTVFSESLNQYDFLDKSPALYRHFSQYPIIGIQSSRNNSVQKVGEGEREHTGALLTAVNQLYPNLKNDLNNYAPELESLLGFAPEVEESGDIVESPKNFTNATNTIFYGAPGTGKSFSIDKTINDQTTIRTVFHPETMSSHFIGSIKPVMRDDDEGNAKLTYEYIAGPFIRAVAEALKAPDEHHWLVIEEINRAPAAAVFGEAFQLLDRRPDGRSIYEIDFPDDACKEHVKKALGREIPRLYIPSNLSLIASMNSSDQAVMPLDTAFKRRWRFVYVPLEFDKGCAKGIMEIVLDDDVCKEIHWSDFAQCVNWVLSEAAIPEDRHLGPYFLSNEELVDAKDALTGKLFIYLWDDVLRHGMRSRLFSSEIRTYGELINSWSEKKRIFSDSFVSLLSEHVVPTAEKSEPATSEPVDVSE